MKLRKIVKPSIELFVGFLNIYNWRTFYISLRSRKMQPEATCPICGFRGAFDAAGTLTPRMNAACPRCSSRERHRLLMLAAQNGFVEFRNKRVLHFAPEPSVKQIIENSPCKEYLSGDINQNKAMVSLNIENIDLPDSTFDVIVCSHILEHVDHKKALSEIYRVLTPGGLAILLFPIVEAWEYTYEDPNFQKTSSDRIAHFGQDDHIKFFGRDVRDHIRAAGFSLSEFVADGPTSAQHALIRGETVFCARKDDGNG